MKSVDLLSSKKPPTPEGVWEKIKVLGEGTYGTVYKVRLDRPPENAPTV